VPPQSFAALRHPGYRAYFIGSALAMMADSVEHVISYWIIFQKFHSPALGGFAMLSHWLPVSFLFGAVGALADRFDPRRMIQIGMALFMAASVGWGVLFLTDTLEMWHAAALPSSTDSPVCSGTLPRQLLIHDIVGTAHLQSAVRLSATARYLGLLLGPAVGGGLLLVSGRRTVLLLNALITCRSSHGCGKRAYGPRFRRRACAGACGERLSDILSTIRDISGNRTIVSMILLAGITSFFVATATSPDAGIRARSRPRRPRPVLQHAARRRCGGALFAGFLLESRGLLQAKPRTALTLAILWCCAIAVSRLRRPTRWRFAILFAVGFLELSFNSMAQTLVQLRRRGHRAV